jgi:hypothetical protein
VILSLEVKQQELEAHHSPPSSAMFNTGGAILPLPHMPSWLRPELCTGTNLMLVSSDQDVEILSDYITSRSIG